MRSFKAIPLLGFGLLLAACGGSAADDDAPGGGGPRPRSVSPIPGGGTSGGPIVDALTVFVLDADGAPVKGAAVVVDHDGGSERKSTDGAGRVDFFGQRFTTASATHVMHGGYRYASLVGARASVQTLVLEKRVQLEAAPPRFAVTTGTVTGWDLLPINTESRARLAVVRAIGGGALIDPPQPTRPGTIMPDNEDGTDHNILINGYGLFPSWGDYALRYDTRATGLAVYAGTWTPNGEPSIALTHLGLATGMRPQEIAIRHRLDQTIEMILSGLPEALEKRETFAGLVTAERTVVPLPMNEVQASAAAPSLRDELANASYLASVRLSSEATIGELPVREVLAERRGVGSVYTFDRILAPPADPTAAARSLAAAPSDGATRHLYTLIDERLGQVVWSVTVFGDDTRAVTLPEVPETMGDPLAEGRLLLEVRAEDLGDVDLDRARFSDLPAPRSIAVARSVVRM